MRMTTPVELDAMREYENHFCIELDDARGEVYRLHVLLKDALWYNFEVAARVWKHPWRETYMETNIVMTAMRHEKFNGIEMCDFPSYYAGTIRDAPPLPLAIIKTELDRAKEHVRMCEIATTAAFDWAPGGALYNELRAATLVGRDHSSGLSR